MKGTIILADGMRLQGTLRGAPKAVAGWVAANTAVVGFQEMITDPTYKGRIVAFTYPEIGNVGVTQAFSESPHVQVAGLVVKVLSEYRSHYLSEDSLENLLLAGQIPCLTDVDTRGLAVHLRDKGEMPAVIAPDDVSSAEVKKLLSSVEQPRFEPSNGVSASASEAGPKVAVINLGVRMSQLQQLARCCRPVLFPFDVDVRTVLAGKPKAVFVSDGPGMVPPPGQTVETIKGLVGKLPILACGLGHVALGQALGCKPVPLKRGHHGANYPLRNVLTGLVEVTEQRHTTSLDRDSVSRATGVELLWENINDGSVEGIRAGGGSATGLQSTLSAPAPGEVNTHIRAFIDAL